MNFKSRTAYIFLLIFSVASFIIYRLKTKGESIVKFSYYDGIHSAALHADFIRRTLDYSIKGAPNGSKRHDSMTLTNGTVIMSNETQMIMENLMEAIPKERFFRSQDEQILSPGLHIIKVTYASGRQNYWCMNPHYPMPESWAQLSGLLKKFATEIGEGN